MSDVDLSKLSNEQLLALHAAKGDVTKLPDNILQSFAPPDPTNPGMATRGDVISPENMPQDPAAGWAATRIRNAATGLAGMPRGAADINQSVVNSLGLPPEVGTAVNAINPLSLAGKFLPSSQQMNTAIENTTGMQPVNTPGAYGPTVDAAVEAGLSGGVAGGMRALLPAASGGALQEAVGSMPEIKGTKWETPARVLAATFGSLAPTAIQRGVEGVRQSSAMQTPENRAASVLARNLERDNSTFGQLQAEHMPGTPLITSAGENVTGALRGATAAPGAARTTVNDVFDRYIGDTEGKVGNAITQNVSPLPPMSTRINTLQGEQSTGSREAYQAAGVPPRPEQRVTAMDQPPTWNTPILKSDKIDSLIANSKDMQTAIANARRLPDFKDVPINSMSMLDKVYKHLGGLEQTQIRAGNGPKARDISTIRNDLRDAITEQNPKYGQALAAYSEPQKLIDAAQAGHDWFKKNMPDDVVAREYGAMPPDQRREALGGVAEYLRSKASNTDRATAAERILNSGNERNRLQSVLSPEDYSKFNGLIEQEKAVAAKAREVTKGSRTVPMANEQADNSGINAGAGLSIIHKVMDGHYGLASLDLLRTIASPIAKRMVGKGNEAANAQLASWLTETDPQKVGLVRSLAENAQSQNAARRVAQQRGLMYGTLAPVAQGVSR